VSPILRPVLRLCCPVGQTIVFCGLPPSPNISRWPKSIPGAVTGQRPAKTPVTTNSAITPKHLAISHAHPRSILESMTMLSGPARANRARFHRAEPKYQTNPFSDPTRTK
jgi:hypothetical protein